jgi:DNA-binding MarR family transcriptional regulator
LGGSSKIQAPFLGGNIRSWPQLKVVMLVFILLMTSVIPWFSNSAAENDNQTSYLGDDSGVRSIRDPNYDIEPNNELQKASLLTSNTHTIINGSLSNSDTVDWYKFFVTKGDNFGNYADRFILVLTDNNTGSGVYLELFGPNTKPPYPHHLARSIVDNALIPNPNATAVIDMVAPIDGYLHARVLPNGVPNGEYRLDLIIMKENNTAYDGDNSFTNATLVDSINGTYFSTVFLDPKWDVHDFYKFQGYKNQTLDIIMGLPTSAKYCLYIFDNQSTKYWDSAIYPSSNIHCKLPETRTYYVRVWAMYNGTTNPDNNYGWYSISFSGNVPPLWQSGAQEEYITYEDSPPFYIEIDVLWNELNNDDDISNYLWNLTSNDWELRNDNEKILSTIYYDNFKIELFNNGTIVLPDERLKVTPLPDKFGKTEVKIGAKDYPAGTFGEHNITIIILPVNDVPIINDTTKWTRYQPDPLDVKKNNIIVTEKNYVKIKVDAYDIEGNELTFTDNTELFDIDPNSGLIEFYADYQVVGSHWIEISVTDKDPHFDNKTASIYVEFIIEGVIDHRPKTRLLTPENNSIIISKFPTLKWNASDLDTILDEITFFVYLSPDLNKVLTLSNEALVYTGSETKFSISDPPLLDRTTYYWTVIPYDEIFTGYCLDGYFIFKPDSIIEAPVVSLISPENNSIFNHRDVELQWSVKYSDQTVVFCDIYLGINDSDLILIEQDFKSFSYFPDRLGFHKYFWKIVPKAGTPPSRIIGDESKIRSFSIDKSYKAPIVTLITPQNRSILKTHNISLSWRVEYKNPKAVEYKLFVSESEKLDTLFKTLSDTFLKFTAPKSTKYYWKIIPYVNNVPGPSSEIRWFSIDTTVVQPIVIPKFPKNNSTINHTWVELQWTLDYVGSIAKVKYEIYLDNSTDNRPGMEQIRNNYRQLFIGMELEDKNTYYWYIIPTVETESGIIVGEFKGYISSFKINLDFQPPPEPNFEIHFNKTYYELNPGNVTEFKITVKNTGNVPLTIDLSYLMEPPNQLFIDFVIKKIHLMAGESKELTISAIIPQNIETESINITIMGSSMDGGLITSENIEIDILPTSKKDSPSGDKKSLDIQWSLVLFLIIIIILISLFMYTKIKRYRVLEHQRREMIYSYVKEHPGEHFRGIQKVLGLEVGTLAHHINKLERVEFIKSRQDGQYRRFYPMDAKIDVKLILSKLQENILNWIKRNPGISGTTIATQMGMNQKIVAYHVNVLQNAGFIYTEKQGREKLCYTAVGV